MAATTSSSFPSITNMIRLDHGHVIALFHRYRLSTSPTRKRALAGNACLALEIHAQLEEEIFYPALAKVMSDNEVLSKSKPEHEQMRQLSNRLRDMSPGTGAFDQSFFQLMGVVLHHIADEESTLLPAAESLLTAQLGELGMQMTKRRLQLLGPHAGEAAITTARSFPVASILLAAGVLMLGTVLFRQLGRGNMDRLRDFGRDNLGRLRDVGHDLMRSSVVRGLGERASHLLS